jgi:AraC family transcriptional regulator
VPQALLEKVPSEAERGGSATKIVPRLTRDPQIEHIAWALKAEFETGGTNGGLFLDSLGTALALYLLSRHSSRSLVPYPAKGGMPIPKLRKLLAYIEDNLDGALTLASLAQVVDLSSSHLRELFRQSMSLSVHQYVVRRRVERARTLLETGKHSSTEVALVSGFAHQSHLARQMRRILGVTPTELRRKRETTQA